MSDNRLIIVEDDHELRETLIELLELNGYKVSGAANGIEFYRALDRDDNYKLAIIDVGLPDQSGIVLAQYARNNTSMSIIILTANDSLENRVASFSSGADLFLSKPFYNDELLAAVAALLQRSEERAVGNSGLTESSVAAAKEDVWRWDVQGSALITPDGNQVALNNNENIAMEAFYSASGKIAGRVTLMQAIYSRDDESAERALDNMIRRFRNKLKESQHQKSPALILTVYGKGYRFTGKIHRSL